MNVLEDIKEEIKRRVAIKDCLAFYGIYPTRGTNIYCCPFHQDSHPSANIIKGTELFHCFPCNKTWDAIDIVREFENCDFKTAMKTLDERYGLGLYGELSHKEKLELARRLKEIEKQKQDKLWWQEYEKVVLTDIIKALRFWEQVQKLTHITRGEYRRGEWKFADLFFESLKRQDWLNWLYDAVCGFDHPECEYDFVYPSGKRELLEMIKSGAISI